MNNLAKTISDNSSPSLVWYGPPIISKIRNMIPLDVSTTNNGEKSINNVKNESIETNLYVRLIMEYPESAIIPPINNRDYYHNERENKENS